LLNRGVFLVQTSDLANRFTPDYFCRPTYAKYPEMPLLAIEIISATQNIQDLLEKAETLIAHGIQTVWTIEPFTNTIFVTTASGVQKFPSQELESNGIKVDFKKIFG
jgi:Uma2 family endonuclease